MFNNFGFNKNREKKERWNRGWTRESGPERVDQRGWTREVGPERVDQREWTRESGPESVDQSGTGGEPDSGNRMKGDREWTREGDQRGEQKLD